jgi:hypothetical protein
MRMVRLALAWLLSLSLVLGTWAPLAVAGCMAASEASAAASSSAGGACGTCDEADGKGQPQQGCPAAFCSAACISGPVTSSAAVGRVQHEIAAQRIIMPSQDALRARAIPPDHPPPR